MYYYYDFRIIQIFEVFKNANVYPDLFVLVFSNFETNFHVKNAIFLSNLTLKTASGCLECKDDMDDAAIMNVLMQSFS